MTFDQWISDMQKLCDEATPGPWHLSHHNGAANLFRLDNQMSAKQLVEQFETNRKLIAASRTFIPQAIELLKVQREALLEINLHCCSSRCDNDNLDDMDIKYEALELRPWEIT